MRLSLSARLLFPILTLLFPALAIAQTDAVSQVVGVFNVLVGLMLVAALLTYALGVVVWACRLGTWPSYRTEAIRTLEWAVATLFTLVVLLGIVQFFQRHPQQATYVISAIVVILVIWMVVYLIAHSGGGEKKAAGGDGGH